MRRDASASTVRSIFSPLEDSLNPVGVFVLVPYSYYQTYQTYHLTYLLMSLRVLYSYEYGHQHSTDK